MAETLGSLCDKLTIVKLKQFHTRDQIKINSLLVQEAQLKEEIDEFVGLAVAGYIPIERLKFTANKVYKQKGNEISPLDEKASIGSIFAQLADANCKLWAAQDKVYDFEAVPMEEKNGAVKKLALLNLERNQCIDAIDQQFQVSVRQLREMKKEEAW